MTTPKLIPDRAMEMICLAVRFNLDSTDIEEVCRRHGLDYEQSPMEAIREAVIADYGLPAPFLPLHIPGWAGPFQGA